MFNGYLRHVRCVPVRVRTCDVLSIHGFPPRGESSVCESTVGLEGDRYCVTSTDHHRGQQVATVCPLRMRKRGGTGGKRRRCMERESQSGIRWVVQ